MSFTKAVFHSTLFLLLVLPLVSVVPASGQSAEGGSAPPAGPSAALDPLRIALLRWYSADTTTSFAVGTQPRGVCFDGANIWVANYGSNTVTKLRANDGQVLGTFAVGTQPANVAFDGANIWVTNFGSANVTKLRASDGKVLGTFSAGPSPFGLAFDGANIWVGNGGAVTKLRASDGKVLGTFSNAGQCYGVAFDGTYIWGTNGNAGTVTRFKLDGTNAGVFTLGAGAIAMGLAFDGANLWVAGDTNGQGSATKLRASDGVVLASIDIGGGRTESPSMARIFGLRSAHGSPDCGSATVPFCRPTTLLGTRPASRSMVRTCGWPATTAATFTRCKRAK